MTSVRLAAATLCAAGLLGMAVPAHAQISDDVVKLGVLTDMSSLYQDSTGPGSLIAAQMAVADYGGKGKGKPVEVIRADHQNKPDAGPGTARSWYDTERRDAIVDVPPSPVRMAITHARRR